MDVGILVTLIALVVLAIALLLFKRRAKRFDNSKDWQKHERDGGGS